jgi:GntR family transcriptional regulator, rspAB operon transcriptional repressor
LTRGRPARIVIGMRGGGDDEARLLRGEPLYEQVYDLLWRKIIAGEIRPGDRLGDADWAQRLDVSRTPVREAIRKLSNDGILAAIASGGYEVRPVHPADLRQVYECRAALEGIAAREAASRLDASAAARLERLVAEAEAAERDERLEAAMACNTQFHDIVIGASGNPHLERLLGSLRRLIQFYRRTLLDRSRADPETAAGYHRHLDRIHHNHGAVLGAIRAGDGAAAERLMREHLLATARDMDALFRVAA